MRRNRTMPWNVIPKRSAATRNRFGDFGGAHDQGTGEAVQDQHRHRREKGSQEIAFHEPSGQNSSS